MTGSGPGGWISGAGSNGPAPSGDRNRERREKFLADHPEWSIVYVRSKDVHEASRGDLNTELVLMADSYLGALMDRLEARYGSEEETRG